MRKPRLNTIDFFTWIGCAELKSRNWWQSNGLQKKSVERFWSIKLTFTSKKLTDFLDFSLVNFKYGWKLFKFSENSSSFASLSFQIKKMSSMYLSHTMGFTACVPENQSQLYPWRYMHMVVKFGSNGSASYLMFDFWIKFKEIAFEYKFCDVNQICRRNFFIWSFL